MVPALRNGRIHIHCFWFDIYTGEIWCFSRKDKTFIMINEESVGDLQVNIKIVLRLALESQYNAVRCRLLTTR